jgi:hypothetical protein
MPNKAIVVFTAKSIERLVREGGTSSWRLNPAHARRCNFAICTRNTREKWGDGQEAHGSAFLVGRIKEVVSCEPTPENDESNENRYLIRFSEFARINVPDAWNGQHNPVRYATLEELGINLADLKWEEMPSKPATPQPSCADGVSNGSGVRPLTIGEAKKGLALAFNVAQEAVEITIRG